MLTKITDYLYIDIGLITVINTYPIDDQIPDKMAYFRIINDKKEYELNISEYKKLLEEVNKYIGFDPQTQLKCAS